MTAHLTTKLRAMLDQIAATEAEILSMQDPRDRARSAALVLAAELYGDSDTGQLLAALIRLDRADRVVVNGASEESCTEMETAVEDVTEAATALIEKAGHDLAGYWSFT